LAQSCIDLSLLTRVQVIAHFASTFGRFFLKEVIYFLRQISLQNGSRSSQDVIRTGGFPNRIAYRAIKN